MLLTLIARLALCELTYTVTATKDGKPIPDSDIVFERIEPSLHRLNTTLTGPTMPKDKGRRVKRTNPIYYSSNWCGAVQHSVSTNKITSVHAYFQVPTLSQRPGVTSFPQFVATWVGIDGATWGSALLQSGVTSQVCTSMQMVRWYEECGSLTRIHSSARLASRPTGPGLNGYPTRLTTYPHSLVRTGYSPLWGKDRHHNCEMISI